MFKNFVLSKLIGSTGDLFVGSVKDSVSKKTYYYSVNTDSGKYSFWSFKLPISLVLEDSDLTKNQANFKLLLIGG